MNREDKTKISIVMPSFNEEKAIGTMIDEIRNHTQDYDTEIVVVDSSSDRTPEIARQRGARVIYQPPQGHGIALREAINAAQHGIIITTDCDNTYPMDYIPKLVSLVQAGSDVVSCNRMTPSLKKEMPLTNKLGNWFFAFLVRVLYGLRVHDVSTGMICMKKNVNERIRLETNYSLPCEIIVRSLRAGFKVTEIDIPYRLRVGEIKLKRWRTGKAYLRCILRYRLGRFIAHD